MDEEYNDSILRGNIIFIVIFLCIYSILHISFSIFIFGKDKLFLILAIFLCVDGLIYLVDALFLFIYNIKKKFIYYLIAYFLSITVIILFIVCFVIYLVPLLLIRSDDKYLPFVIFIFSISSILILSFQFLPMLIIRCFLKDAKKASSIQKEEKLVNDEQ